MLHISDWNLVAKQYPPLTEDEITAYIARDPKIVPTDRQFRIDFSKGHGWKTFAFNKEARMVFIDKYLARVAGGAYFTRPSPPQLLTEEHIGEILDEHMRYCRDRYRKSEKPKTAKELRDAQRRNARNGRKTTVCPLLLWQLARLT